MAVERIFDLSGGIQTATSWPIRKPNEVESVENGRFDDEVGSVTRRYGYTRRLTAGTNEEALGFHEAKFDTGPIMFVASDNGANTIIRSILSDGTTATIISDLPRHTRCQFIDHLDEVYVAGITTDTEERINIRNIRLVSGVLTVSTSRNLFTAPKAAFIGERSGKLYAMNVEVDGVVHPDRAYESSPPMGAITYIKGDQDNTYAPVTLVNQTPVMTDYTVPSGVAAASTEVNVNNRAWQAFNKDTANLRWLASTTTGWIRYDFGSGNSKVITHYGITGQNDTFSARNPKDWTFQGSPDASSWTTIQTVSGSAQFGQNENRVYATSNTTAYRYYRLNITAPQTVDDYVGLKEFQLFSALSGSTRYRQAAVDSVRYIKPGMEVDVYEAGIDNKVATITVDSVNNAEDTFDYLPFSQTVTSVSTTDDTIDVPSASVNYPVGTPVVINATGAMPTGLTADVTYYAIPYDSDSIQLATSRDLALIGDKINITGAGSGTITISLSYDFGDNYEVWLKDRRDDLSVLWNTDYRTPQTADYLRIPAGSASDTSITGWAKSNNRLNIFTATSMHQFDGANFLPIFENIGCISHRTIQNSGQFIIWLDANGNVRARDSTSGQDEIISRFVRNRHIDTVPDANLSEAVASLFDGNYKINFGLVGDTYLRMVYNVDSNSWWRETHTRNFKYNVTSRISGKDRLYQITDGIAMYLDEDGDLDYDNTIPFVVQYGRRNMGSAFKKAAIGMYVYGENITSAKIELKLPGKQANWINMGTLTEPISRVEIGDKKAMEARDFDIRISYHSKGNAPRIDGLEFHYSQLEENFG